MKYRTAIIQDCMFFKGGAERVLKVFLEMFPEADLYTLFVVPSAKRELESKYPGVKIYTSVFQKLINNDYPGKYISVIKFLSWLYWEVLDLSEYNLIISSSHSYMSKNVKRPKNGFHLSYVHTPPRYLYEEYNELEVVKKFPVNIVLWPFLAILRKIDKNGANRPDVILANSNNVANRIKKYYARDCQVVYPPVEVDKTDNLVKKEYFVCVSRLVKQKGIELAVRTCTKYSLPLVVVGNGDEYLKLKRIAGRTIQFIKKCDDIEKSKIMSAAKALVYPAIEEDFGIVPVEALKLGTPVVAFRSGGVTETVIEGKNGVFFQEFNIKSLKKALDRLDRIKINRVDCINSAEKFSASNFKKNIKCIINSVGKKYIIQ